MDGLNTPTIRGSLPQVENDKAIRLGKSFQVNQKLSKPNNHFPVLAGFNFPSHKTDARFISCVDRGLVSNVTLATNRVKTPACEAR